MRVKRGSHRKNSRKKVLKLAKGYYGKKSNAYRVAQQAVDRALAFAYRDRRQKKRQFRSLWIVRINAAARENGLSYNRLISGLRLAGIDLNRKVLADIAVHDAEGFTALVAVAKEAVADEVGAKIHEPVGTPAKRPGRAAALAEAPAEDKAEAEAKPKSKAEPKKAETAAPAEAKPKPEPEKEQEATPAEKPAKAAPAPAAAAEGSKDDLEAMTIPELEALATAHGIEESDLAGSGANGNVVKADWVRAAQGVEHLTVPELEKLAERRGIAESDVEGSGASGNVVKADWVRAAQGVEHLTVPELEKLAERRGIAESDVEGSGASGNVVKADWVKALSGSHSE